MVICRECSNLMEVWEKPAGLKSGRARGRCGPKNKGMNIDQERDCEDFTTVRVDEIFRKEGEVK